MHWLALHFPALALEVQAPAVAEGPSPPHVLVADGRILLCNETAAAAGIVAGTTLATACSIEPALRHATHSPERTARRLRQLAELCYGFSAQIALAPPTALLLEAGRSLKLFGSLQALQQGLHQACQALAHQAVIRDAATPEAALALARSGADELRNVALQHTPIPPQNQERLGAMGIHCLGPLLDLPEQELGQRFGPQLLNYLQRLTGRRPDPQRCIEPAQAFDSSLHLLEVIRHREALHFPMQRLLLELEHWLIGRQLGALRLQWTFAAHRNAVSMSVAFAEPQQCKAALLDISRLRLSTQELPDEVIDIRLQVNDLRAWIMESRGLFRLDSDGGHRDDKPEQARSRLVDQLRARLGEDACHGIRAQARHCPESAWQLIPPAVRQRHPAHDPSAAGLRPNRPRPLWLFDPPQPIAPGSLRLIHGPERIQSNWWETTVARDYYIAEHRGGARCWVFIDHEAHWYLHGYFG